MLNMQLAQLGPNNTPLPSLESTVNFENFIAHYNQSIQEQQLAEGTYQSWLNHFRTILRSYMLHESD